MKKFLEELNESRNDVHDSQMVISRLCLISGEYSRKVMSSEFMLTAPENDKYNALCDAINQTIIRVSSTKIIGHHALKEILLDNILNELVD